jgi:hypothetical protein
MKVRFPLALAAASALAVLGLAACSGGLTAAPAGSTAPASGAPSASTPAASTPPGSSGLPGSGSAGGTTVSVDAPIGSFPIPPGAQVVGNAVESSGEIEIGLTNVSGSDVESFYTSALPADGYTITSNTVVNGDFSGQATAIEFTGHGYSGDIGAATDLGLTGLPFTSGELIGISLTPQ